jgi:hypothetical protein
MIPGHVCHDDDDSGGGDDDDDDDEEEEEDDDDDGDDDGKIFCLMIANRPRLLIIRVITKRKTIIISMNISPQLQHYLVRISR